MKIALEESINPDVCETCVERGRPNEPVYRMGMCTFCYHGLPHPKATSEQLAQERLGGYVRHWPSLPTEENLAAPERGYRASKGG